MTPQLVEMPSLPHARCRVLGWGAWLLASVTCLGWLAVWLLSALTLPPPEPLCQRQAGMWRGAVHLHALGHDGRDRSEQLLAAAQAACLDFIVVTEHHGARSLEPGLYDGVLVLDGAEWTVGAHHLNQLAGLWSGDDSGFRVLNHPWGSGVERVEELSDEELAAAARGGLGVEVINLPRLRRAAPFAQRWLAYALGSSRLDRSLSALRLPGPDLALWIELQQHVRRSLPAFCGSDGHGGVLEYHDGLTSAVTMIVAPPEGLGIAQRARWVREHLERGESLCVDEGMGRPGVLELALDHGRCELAIDAQLPDDAHWELLAGTERVAEGRSNARIAASADQIYSIRAWRSISLGWLGSVERLWVTGPARSTFDLSCTHPSRTGRP